MKLYFAPGACSLSDHIALHEAGMKFDRVRVDLKAGLTEGGTAYKSVNPKGYVPALELEGGEVLTENVAILSWVADQAPSLQPDGELGRVRLVEMLTFIATEFHKTLGRILFPTAEADAAAATSKLATRLQQISAMMKGDYLFGSRPSTADAYLYVMMRWAIAKQQPLPEAMQAFVKRMEARPAVQESLAHEGLKPAAESAPGDKSKVH